MDNPAEEFKDHAKIKSMAAMGGVCSRPHDILSSSSKAHSQFNSTADITPTRQSKKFENETKGLQLLENDFEEGENL